MHFTTGASSATARTSGTEQPSTTATEDEAMPSAQAALTSCMKSPYPGNMGEENRQWQKAGDLTTCAKNEGMSMAWEGTCLMGVSLTPYKVT